MNLLMKIGPALFAAGFLLLGLIGLMFLTLIPGLQPVPEEMKVDAPWIYLNSAFLILAGTALALPSTVRPAALSLSLFFACWALWVHIPKIIGAPGDVGAWVSGFETIAIAGVAWMLAGRLVGDRNTAFARIPVRSSGLIGRLCFGTALIVFGIVHLLYRDLIASMIPGWLPGGALWPLFTGAVNIAAGISILSAFHGRLGAAGVGLMYGSWIILVHPGRVAADIASNFEWSFLAIAIVLTGAAWIVLGGFDADADEVRP